MSCSSCPIWCLYSGWILYSNCYRQWSRCERRDRRAYHRPPARCDGQRTNFADGQKERKESVHLFSDAVQSGRAKLLALGISLIDTKPECSRLFYSVSMQAKLFPAVALNVDIADVDALKKELAFRYSDFGHAVKQVQGLFSSPRTAQITTRSYCLTTSLSGTLCWKLADYPTFSRRFRVVEVDLNREVRRCFRCQTYGNIAKSANNACVLDEVCGYCAGDHSTKECTRTGHPKCANFSKAHRAGDPSCSLEIRGVNRFRAAIDQWTHPLSQITSSKSSR